MNSLCSHNCHNLPKEAHTPHVTEACACHCVCFFVCVVCVCVCVCVHGCGWRKDGGKTGREDGGNPGAWEGGGGEEGGRGKGREGGKGVSDLAKGPSHVPTSRGDGC